METLILIVKCAAVGAIIVFCIFLLNMILLGRKLAGHTPQGYAAMVQKKKRYRTWMVATLAFAVLCIEVAVQLSGHERSSPLLFYIHMALVVAFILFLWLLGFRFTGDRHPTAHRMLFYPFILSFLGVACTGSVLLYRL